MSKERRWERAVFARNNQGIETSIVFSVAAIVPPVLMTEVLSLASGPEKDRLEPRWQEVMKELTESKDCRGWEVVRRVVGEGKELLLTYDAKSKMWIGLIDTAPFSFATEKDLSDQSTDACNIKILKLLFKFINNASEEQVSSLKALLAKAVLVGLATGFHQTSTESTPAAVIYQDKQSIQVTSLLKKDLDPPIAHFIPLTEVLPKLLEENKTLLGNIGFEVVKDTNYPISGETSEESCEDFWETLLGAAYKSASGFMSEQGTGSEIEVFSAARKSLSKFFIPNNEYALYSQLRNHFFMNSSRYDPETDSSITAKQIFGDANQSSLMRYLNENKELSKGYPYSLDQYFAVVNCSCEADEAMQTNAVLTELSSLDFCRFMGSVLFCLSVNCAPSAQKFSDMIKAKSELQPWHKQNLDSECIIHFVERMTEKKSRIAPLSHNLSDVYNFKGKNLAVLLMFPLPGASTTGFANVLRRMIKRTYPRANAQCISTETSRDKIIKDYMQKYPGVSQEEAIQATRHEAKNGYFKEIDDYIRSIGRGSDILNVMILMKNYTAKTAEEEVEKLRQFIDDRLPVNFFGVVQQDSINFPLVKVQSGRYVNTYPFSHFFIARCLKKVATRKNHKSFLTDEGVDFIKKFSQALSYHRNFSYSLSELKSIGIDFRLPIDWTTSRDSQFWQKNLLNLNSVCRAIEGMMQGPKYTTEADLYSMKTQLARVEIFDDWHPNPDSSDDNDYIYNAAYTDKIRTFTAAFINGYYAGIVKELARMSGDRLDGIFIDGDSISYCQSLSSVQDDGGMVVDDVDGKVSHYSSEGYSVAQSSSYKPSELSGQSKPAQSSSYKPSNAASSTYKPSQTGSSNSKNIPVSAQYEQMMDDARQDNFDEDQMEFMPVNFSKKRDNAKGEFIVPTQLGNYQQPKGTYVGRPQYGNTGGRYNNTQPKRFNNPDYYYDKDY
jgi:hypothetical protein